MITRIGIMAGEIWDYLEKNKRQALMGDIISDLKKDRDIALMSIGWLAREGHIVLEGRGPDYTIKLT